ncbi:MAG: hypothetical protein PHD19_15195 [Dechloromonas sp.]|nr:hypothetical protein [Dechloromonas sp.]
MNTLDMLSGRRSRLLRSAAVLAAACLLGSPAAADAGDERFTVGAFGTLGVARTDNADIGFSRDQSQARGISDHWSAKIDSLLGVQVNFRATDSVELVGQVLSRYGAHGDFRPEVAWAFARYDVNPHLALRVGRLGTELYMLGDSRHVGYSQLTVRPPNDFYGQLPFYHLDGADIAVTVPTGPGLLRAKAFYGRSDEIAPVGDEKLDLDGNMIGGAYLDYQLGNWQWRATYAWMDLKHDLPQPVASARAGLYGLGFTATADAMGLKGKAARFYSLGAVYDRGPLQFQAMLGQIRHDNALYQDSTAGYLLAGYRIGQLTPYAGYSWVRSKDKGLTTGVAEVDNAVYMQDLRAAFHLDQKTFTLGARWDFRRNMALKAQVDMIRGSPESIYLRPPNSITPQFDGRINVFSLTLDFAF